MLTIGGGSQVSAITASPRLAYFATPLGTLRYDITADAWVEPLPTPFGVSDIAPSRVAVSFDDERVWLEIGDSRFLYERVFGRWSPTSQWPDDAERGRYIEPRLSYVTPVGWSYLNDGRLVGPDQSQYAASIVYADENGFEWMAFDRLGVAMSPAVGGRLRMLFFGPLSDWVQSLSLSGDTLFIGGVALGPGRSGVTVLDLTRGEFDYFEQGQDRRFPVFDALTLSVDDKELAIGTDDGVYVLNRADGSVVSSYGRHQELAFGSVTSVALVGDALITGGTHGVTIIASDTSGAQAATILLEGEKIHTLLVDQPGTERARRLTRSRPTHVWIGAESGAYRLAVQSGALKKLDDASGVTIGPVRAIARYGETMWFLSNAGLAQLDIASGERDMYPEFSAQGVTAMAVNRELIAVGSNDGVTVTWRRLKDRPRRTLDTNDGLPSSRVSALAFHQDYLWIGSDRGLSRWTWNHPRERP